MLHDARGQVSIAKDHVDIVSLRFMSDGGESMVEAIPFGHLIELRQRCVFAVVEGRWKRLRRCLELHARNNDFDVDGHERELSTVLFGALDAGPRFGISGSAKLVDKLGEGALSGGHIKGDRVGGRIVVSCTVT